MTKEKAEFYNKLEIEYEINSSQMSEMEFLEKLVEEIKLQEYRKGYQTCKMVMSDN